MVLGHNFYSTEGFKKQLAEGKTDDSYATGRTLIRCLDEAKLPKQLCFFTNFFMGLGNGPNTGRFPGAWDHQFVQSCRDFFILQLTLQRPSLVLVLGRHVPPLLAPLSPSLARCSLARWEKIRNFRELDEADAALISNVKIENLDFTFTVAALIHPSLRGPNLRHRSFRGLFKAAAEREILIEAWKTSRTVR
jgi:hypothetical protein